MLDDNAAAEESAPDELTIQAILYASGELEEPQAAEFEQRLAEDQAARDALLQAVQFSQLAVGHAPPAPDPAYRSRVRQRLRQKRRHLSNLRGMPGSFGPAALWVALGAAVAILLMVVLGHLATTQTTAPSTVPVAPPAPQDALEPTPADSLEQRVAKAEKRANRLVAKLAQTAADAPERQKLCEQLQREARTLVELHVAVLAEKTGRVEKDLAKLNAELGELRGDMDKHAQQRYEDLLDKAKKRQQ